MTTQHNLLESKVGKSAEEITFRKANQAVNNITIHFHLCQQAVVLYQLGQTKQDSIVAGEISLVPLYGGGKEECLDILRYRHIAFGTKYSATDLSS